MNKINQNIAALLLVGCIVSSGSAGQQTDFASTERLVLLTNGNVLRGFVEQQFGTVIIQTAEGSRLVLSSDQVEKICDSLEDALAEKRQRVQKDDAAGHRQLFHWCLKHQLLDEAQVELNQLQTMKLTAKELNTLLQQLHSSIARDQKKNTPFPTLDTSPVSPSKTVVVPSEFEIADLPAPRQSNQPDPSISPQIAPVSFEEGTGESSSSSMITGNELERITKRLPSTGSSMFKKRIEPLVFRNCANAGCHDAKSTEMPLMRLVRGEAIPKRMSQQNLYRVLSYAGSGEPESSPLLIAATTAHGGTAAAPLNVDSDQFLMLAEWVASMASPASGAGILPAISLRNQTGPNLKADTPPVDARPLTIAIPPGPSESVPKSTGNSSTSGQHSVPVIPSLENSHETFLPKDPFDPEIFNRQFLKRSNPDKPINK
jgi:hypothetical protein